MDMSYAASNKQMIRWRRLLMDTNSRREKPQSKAMIRHLASLIVVVAGNQWTSLGGKTGTWHTAEQWIERIMQLHASEAIRTRSDGLSRTVFIDNMTNQPLNPMDLIRVTEKL
jgi:hypothetical protein